MRQAKPVAGAAADEEISSSLMLDSSVLLQHNVDTGTSLVHTKGLGSPLQRIPGPVLFCATRIDSYKRIANLPIEIFVLFICGRNC